MPSRPGTSIRRGSRAPQAADHRRGERAKRGETTSSRSGYSPAGMAGCAPDAGGSSVAMGDCPLSAGKNSTPSVPPGRWAVRRKRISVDIWKKSDEVNEKQAFRTPSVGIGQGLHPQGSTLGGSIPTHGRSTNSQPPQPTPLDPKARKLGSSVPAHGRSTKPQPPQPTPPNPKARKTNGRSPHEAGRPAERRPASSAELSPRCAVSAHAAHQAVGRLRTAFRQRGIASLARANPGSRLRVQRPRLRAHRPLSGAHRLFGEGRIEEIRGHDLLQ